MDWMPPSSRVQPEEVEQGGTVFLSLFLRVESSPSADSFQDVARSIHYGVEEEVGHSMYSERHARYAVGDDLALLRVADPCHAEVGHRKCHRTPLATLLHNAHFVRGICHRLDLAVLEQAHIFKPVGLFDVSDGLLDSPSRHVALHHLPEGIARGALREGRQQHHRLLPEPLDDDHVQQSVRDVWKAHRHDAVLDGDTPLSAVVVELDDFPVPHLALPRQFTAHDIALPASYMPLLEPYYEIQPV